MCGHTERHHQKGTIIEVEFSLDTSTLTLLMMGGKKGRGEGFLRVCSQFRKTWVLQGVGGIQGQNTVEADEK